MRRFELVKAAGVAAVSHFVITFGGVLCAFATRELVSKLALPDVYVVRKVDYNHVRIWAMHTRSVLARMAITAGHRQRGHSRRLLNPRVCDSRHGRQYPEERSVMMINFIVVLAVYWHGGYSKRVPGSAAEIAAVFASSWLQVAVMEFSLQSFGARKMDLVKFAERAPLVVSAVVQTLEAADLPLLVRFVAVLWQTFLEGALYFTSMFTVATIARGGGRLVPVLYVLWAWLFRTTVCVFHGWPQPVVIGSEAEGKRAMLSTLMFRIPQIIALVTVSRTPRLRQVWWPLPLVQGLVLGYYFFLLRYMGRSYLELLRPASAGAVAAAEEVPLVADIALTLVRVSEPIMGAATAFFVAMQILDRVRPVPSKAD
jgi:hypothetical protein